ncbi:hypothetical protein V6N11_056091 [Hibiscus sabdariffa]|uniref:Zinc finger PMZ-type domain-containing protein n=1 Tax=Hibiscus sabdariffa TaxID=183260 RepID=A0ABR2T2T2_9ROSI
MVMSRLHVKRTWASKWRTHISPKALEKLEHNMEQSTHCRLVWNGDGGFEVQHGEDQHIVDMKQLKCTWRAWEFSGIPCCHAICAMYQENKRPEDYVSNWYNKEKYLAAYNQVLQPNVASSTTSPPGMVHGPRPVSEILVAQGYNKSTRNGSQYNSECCVNNISSKLIKAQVGIGLYTDLKTGQIWNLGTSTKCVVTRASKRKIGEADPSQFQHHSKGKGLRWKGNTDVSTRQLQEKVETVRKKRGRPPKRQTLGTQSSQT